LMGGRRLVYVYTDSKGENSLKCISH
jgi:hypothetical protein